MNDALPLGATPKDWATARLDELSEFITKGATPTTYGFGWTDEGVLFLRSECVSEHGFQLEGSERIGTDAHAALARSTVKAGDLLVTITGNVGRVCRYPLDLPDANINQHIARVRVASRERALPEFLRHVLGTAGYRRYYERIVTGLAYPQISLAQVRSTVVPLPPLGEQSKIATILSSVEDAIETTQSVIDQLQVVKKAMMSELLTRGLPGKYKRFKQTQIGEVPEDWEVQPLAECLREPIRNGYSPVCATMPTGRWILHLGAVTFDGFNPLAVKPAPLDDRRIEGAIVESGDLLMSRSNTRERVGLVGVYRGVPPRCGYPDLMMRLRLGPGMLADFLELVLLGERARTYLSSAARGTSESMVKINRDLVGAFHVQVPGLHEQRQIVAAIGALTARRDQELAVRAALRALKAALMSVLLTGEIRVKPDEEAA